MKRMIILAAALGSLMAAQALSDTATQGRDAADTAACTVGDCGSCPIGPDCGSCGGCSMADAAH
jgi:hypothetical protein